MHTSRWLLVAAAALVASGCYKTPKPNCTFSCGDSSACPSDYMCGTDNVCHLMQGGSLAACDQTFNDAAPSDAPLADAPVDASAIDGPPGIDAMVDAHVDAMVDANTCPALAIMDDGTEGAGGQDLVISLVQPKSGGKIELYNTSAADIDLSTRTYQLVVPGVATPIDLSASGVTVKTHGYANVSWDAADFGDLSGGGELVLYMKGAGRQPTDIGDFICWDTDAGAVSKADAQTAKKWSTDTPACVAALTGTAIERLNDKTGTLGADFDPTSTRAPRSCP